MDFRFSKFYFHDLYSKVKQFFFPRQKWLYKKLPKHWTDLDGCIEICVLERFKYFVEEEKCFENTDYKWAEEPKKLGEEIKKYYELLTIRIPELNQQLEEAWGKVPDFNLKDISPLQSLNHLTYKERYGTIDELEKQIYDLQTEIMVWVINKRNYLWT